MPRFSVAFTKRKSASEPLDNVPPASSDTPSFRVLDRTEVANGPSFDGGSRLARASKSFAPRTNPLDLGAEENMFVDLKANRGSNISNTTKGTSTDDSSRHSNASTAPSSADLSAPQAHDDIRPTAPQEPPTSHTSAKSSGSGFLDRATRTFSFGGQKKQSVPPPIAQEPVPDLPPVLSLSGRENAARGTSRGTTASTAHTATPADHEKSALDMGGDFGSMFKGFGKRASTATPTPAGHDNASPRLLTGNRRGTPGPAGPDGNTPTEPLLSQHHSPAGDDSLSSPVSPEEDVPPPVPRHEHLNSFKCSSRPNDVLEDEDAKFLRESITAMKFLSEPYDDAPNRVAHASYRRDEHSAPAKPTTQGSSREDNMFEGSASKMNRTSQTNAPQGPDRTPRTKVMTPAQFEKYRQDKETLGTASREAHKNAAPTVQNAVGRHDDDDDEDGINYDDDEDEQEKSRQQTKQRRKQEAHMAVYRQQMMKVTGETSSAAPAARQQPVRPTMSLPLPTPTPLGHLKTPSPEPVTANPSSEEDDEDVPLAILQAHGFPHKNRPPSLLGPSGSSPNLRTSMVGSSSARPASMVGGGDAASNNGGRRSQNLPAFARNLPRDPFVGASIARPAIRESLSFADVKRQPSPQPTPGGLVGVIANEERSRAMRRGSPSVDVNKLMSGAVNPNGNPGQDPFAAIPAHMMYNTSGMAGMPMSTPPSMLTPGDQAQIHMNQQMQHFMQMQMQFMHMMANNQSGVQLPPPQQPAMQPPYGGLPGNPSMGDLNRHSMMMMTEPMMETPHQMDRRMRTMSMVQPSSSSFIAPFGQAIPSIRGAGETYSPSIAPSERSNVGLPGRYRPVSQASAGQQMGSNTMSGNVSNWSDDKSRSTVKLLNKSRDGSDDDEEQGWKAMKAKRDKKRSVWRSKRPAAANEVSMAF